MAILLLFLALLLILGAAVEAVMVILLLLKVPFRRAGSRVRCLMVGCSFVVDLMLAFEVNKPTSDYVIFRIMLLL
jgi:hypothetical protein